MPKARLTAFEPAGVVFSVEIRKPAFTLGRREGSDGVIPVDNSVGVSGQHLTIRFSGGRFTAQDDKSTFGTTVNGQPIPKGQPIPLESGAIIGLGPAVKLRFEVAAG